jgi:hypothetical protein
MTGGGGWVIAAAAGWGCVGSGKGGGAPTHTSAWFDRPATTRRSAYGAGPGAAAGTAWVSEEGRKAGREGRRRIRKKRGGGGVGWGGWVIQGAHPSGLRRSGLRLQAPQVNREFLLSRGAVA